MISIMMMMTLVVILIKHVNFITCEHYLHQPDPGLSYSDLGCRSQPLDSAVIMEQSAGCGPDGVGLSPSEDTPKCSEEKKIIVIVAGTEIQIGFDTDPLVPGIETTTLTV